MKGFITLIDFETTGLTNSRATEIGLIALGEDLEEVGRYTTLIKPPIEPEKNALSVSNLTREEIFQASPFSNYWPDISLFLNNRVLVGHYIKFDLGVLQRELADLDISQIPPSYCTYENGRQYLQSSYSDLKLPTIMRALNKQIDLHRADNDAEACGYVLKLILRKNNQELNKLKALKSKTIIYEQPTSNSIHPTMRGHISEDLHTRFNLPKARKKTNIQKTQSHLESTDSLRQIQSTDEIRRLANKIITNGRTQVCITGIPSIGLNNAVARLASLGFCYEKGPIRKTLSAFLVVGSSETGTTKIHDAQLHNIPICQDQDFEELINALASIGA